ncbi:beta-lactamase [Stackebrandtia endophytica]|uniref:Beta-lactamase n=1 Tax=Stackebrandtia endophytica TaxID=1496996 RepID=A0A543AUE0_9ACTN|nr:serine hydrolase domain-containing protein [Stackebrandtia endophytica]TQL76191.1 beta-lactamase [Stackebrandtia endophytica]
MSGPFVPVYSIAKVYTAAAILSVVDIDDAIGSRLPDLSPEVASLSIRDILSHRSGLNDYFAWPDYRAAVAADEDPWPVSAVVDRAEVSTRNRFGYSNIGYLLLRLTLERVTRKPFFDALDELVLRPLKVTARPFDDRTDWRHCDHPEVTEKLRRYHPGWVYPGTFLARVEDAAAGIGRLMAGGLGTEVPTAMTRAFPVDAPGHPLSPSGYGLGLMTRGFPPTVVGHGGGGPGFSLFAATTVDGSRSAGMVTTNEGENLDLIAECVARVEAGKQNGPP